MRIVFMTRFSFLGAGGWRSQASKKAELLFDEGRLEKRFWMFEKITLPTLMSQTDKDFDWIVLSSSGMPGLFRRRLRQTVSRLKCNGRSQVLFREPRHVAGVFRRSIQRMYQPDDLICSVVLDDDDGLSDDFVAICREQARFAWENRDQDKDYVITSFPRGYSLILSENGCDLARRNVPYTNLGLALTAPAKCKRNLFSMSHNRIGQRHPNHLVKTDRPFYLRSVHTSNDSRAIVPKKAEPAGFAEAQEFFKGVDFETIAREQL